MAGSPPLTLTLNGTNFNSGVVTLVWNGTTHIQAAFGSNDTQVSFTIPASLITNPGSISLQLIDSVPGDRPSNTVSFTINPRGPTACALFGTYDFLFSGFETNTKGFGRDVGAMMAVGAFGVDATGTVSGEMDFTDYPLDGGVGPAAFTGTCSNSATHNQGTLTFTFSNNTTIIGTLTHTFALQQGSGPPQGRLFEPSQSAFATSSASGIFLQSVPDSALSGAYVFGLVGTDVDANGSQIGIVGGFTDNNGNLTAGAADINDGGVVTADAPISGAVSVMPPDAFSRIVINVSIGGQGMPLTVYVNSPSKAVALGRIFVGTGHNGLLGFISSQSNPGAYNNNSLSAPLVISTWGVPPPLYTNASFTAPSDTTLGLASGFNNSAGTFNLLFDNVSGGVSNLNQTVTGATYSVGSNGRATVAYTSGGTVHDFVYYLDNANDGYILGLGNTAEFGFFQPQAPGPFNTASINGTFAAGTFLPETPASPNLTTEITLDNGNLTANTPSGALTGTYAVAPSGRGTASVNLPVFGANDLVFYVIGPTNVVTMGSDSTTSDAITLMHF